MQGAPSSGTLVFRVISIFQEKFNDRHMSCGCCGV
jgi:hypothetical protein